MNVHPGETIGALMHRMTDARQVPVGLRLEGPVMLVRPTEVRNSTARLSRARLHPRPRPP